MLSWLILLLLYFYQLLVLYHYWYHLIIIFLLLSCSIDFGNPSSMSYGLFHRVITTSHLSFLVFSCIHVQVFENLRKPVRHPWEKNINVGPQLIALDVCKNYILFIRC